MNDHDDLAGALSEIASSVRAIAHGGAEGPGGLEGLAMAIAGPHLRVPLSRAVTGGPSRSLKASWRSRSRSTIWPTPSRTATSS